LKKALVLAGGFDQIALIEELKIRGYYVILADYYPHPVAKPVADKHYQVSTLDIDKVIEVARIEKVELVTTACTDQALLTVARVSEILELPFYLDFETARNVTNKEYMKQRFLEFSIPTAKHIIVDTLNSIQERIIDFQYPLIVKPVDCNSSKGVLKVNKFGELLRAVENAKNLSRTQTAIVEEFIEGKEYTVDFWIEHGEPVLLMASEIRKLQNRETFTINGCRTLPELIEEKVEKLKEIAKKISVAFALDNMPMFMQVIDNGEDIYVLEFSARMGGGTKYKMIELYSGVPIMKIYVDRILGILPVLPHKLTRKNMLLSFVYCKAGVAKKIVGLQELQDKGVVFESYQYKPLGTRFIKAENSGDRLLGVLLMAESNEEIRYKEKETYEQLSVLDENGYDIILRELNEEGGCYAG